MTTTPTTTRADELVRPPESRPPTVRTRSTRSLFDPTIVRRAVIDALVKVDPRVQARNPVMFVVLVGSAWTTVLFFRGLAHGTAADNVFVGLVAAWLWFTVLFANFAEAMA